MPADLLAPVRSWFGASGDDPCEAVLCTVDAVAGGPAVHRVVLRRSGPGFLLGTGAPLGTDLAVEPRTVVCLTSPAGDHARVACTAGRVDDLTADRLFDTLGRAAQLAAWPGDARTRFAGQLVPRPHSWVGVRLEVHRVDVEEAAGTAA